MRYLTLTCCLLLGAVFVASAVGKLRGRDAYAGFTAAVTAFTGLNRAGARLIAAAVVTAELLVAGADLVPLAGAAGPAASLAMLGVFTLTLIRARARGVSQPCHCFTSASTPAGTRHIVRNLLLMMVAGIAMAGCLRTPRAWPPEGVSPAGAALAVLVAALFTGAVVLWDDLTDLVASGQG